MLNDKWFIDIGRRTLAAAVLAFVAALVMTGCGGSDGTVDDGLSPSPSSTVIEGRVADGYLVGATVFLDRNGNQIADPDEPQTTTGSGGRYGLEVAPGDEGRYPVVVKVVGGRTLDEDDAATVPYGYTLESPPGQYAFISPFTTLVQQELRKNASYRLEDAEVLVRTRFGLDDSVSLWQDYLQNAGAAWGRTHQTATILAEMNGRLLEMIRLNLGGSIPASDYPAASAVIGDLLMKYADDISLALSDTVTTQSRSTSDIVSWLMDKIESGTLNQNLLDRYSGLLAEYPSSWDAAPPAIVARTPAQNAAVPVTTAITVSFDEPLDPSSVGSTPVLVSGDGRTFSGKASYDPNLQQLAFVPDQPFFALTDYSVELAPQLADAQGNQVGPGINWSFSTIFKLSPPPLPAF
jgi:hypothetical protein